MAGVPCRDDHSPEPPVKQALNGGQGLTEQSGVQAGRAACPGPHEVPGTRSFPHGETGQGVLALNVWFGERGQGETAAIPPASPARPASRPFRRPRPDAGGRLRFQARPAEGVRTTAQPGWRGAARVLHPEPGALRAGTDLSTLTHPHRVCLPWDPRRESYPSGSPGHAWVGERNLMARPPPQNQARPQRWHLQLNKTGSSQDKPEPGCA